MTPLDQLLDRVGTRARVSAIGSNLRRSLLTAAGIALLAVIASRLLGVLPGAILPTALWALAILAPIVALLLARRPSRRQIARLIDERTAAKELFLTATLAGESPVGFEQLVVSRATEQAAEIKPAQVIAFHWQRGTRDVAIALALVAGAFAWLPQFDPFKRESARERLAEQKQRLIETKKLTEIRREELTQKKETDAAQVEAALARLEKTFKEAKPAQRETTLKELSERQKELGELWRKANNPELRMALDQAAQNFGQTDPKKLEAWRRELQQGDASAVKKELSEIAEQMKNLAAMPDSAEKRALQEQLAKRLSDTAQAMKQMANSPQINAALQRALEQMDLSKFPQLSKEAAQAMANSLQLSQEELDQLAETLKDARKLEEMLKNLQMAQRLADQGKLDGEACKECNGMPAYSRLFQEKLNGPGLLGKSGTGTGPGSDQKTPPGEVADGNFTPGKIKGQLAGGKPLMEWKTREVGDSGARTEEYQTALRNVQQGVAEAIQQEQVPPGYHDTIKRYFDSLPEKQ